MEKQLELLKLNINEHTDKKKTGETELTYLSWAWAWAEFLKVFPDATYKVRHYDNKPYFFDENLGYMIFTEVTAGGVTKEMWLPVMNGANKAMKATAWKYTVKGYKGAPDTIKEVDSADMFDINKTIMRCLVKNLAMFGLGIYIYAGEDLPDDDEMSKIESPKTPAVLHPDCTTEIIDCKTLPELQTMVNKWGKTENLDLLKKLAGEIKSKIVAASQPTTQQIVGDDLPDNLK